MSSAMVSKWPVLLFLPVASGDRDEEGRLTEAACERMFAAGRAEYFAECRTIDGDAVEIVGAPAPRRTAPVGDEVSISVNVAELFPDRFTMTARIRPAAGDGIAADAVCTVSAGEVTVAVRDELIAMAHAAPHWH
jgi:methionine aminopeptidase